MTIKAATLAFGIAAVSITRFSAGAEVPFEDVAKNPSQFNHKRITVRGLADVGGVEFALWRDEGALKHANLKQYICIDVRFPRGVTRNPYEYANLHFVKVTGIVDTTIHCSMNADPFAIRLERVDILPGDRLRQFLPILGFFRNDTSKTINIKTSWGAASLRVRPGVIDCFAIQKGNAEATTLSGKPFARCDLIPPRAIDRYYDRQTKAYDYRITQNGIDPVLPNDAKGWKRGYTADRD